MKATHFTVITFLGWLSCVYILGGMYHGCVFEEIDLENSEYGCYRPEHSEKTCIRFSHWACNVPATFSIFVPSMFGRLLPILGIFPVMAIQFMSPAFRSLSFQSRLVKIVSMFVAFIMPIRFFKRWTGSDPSGHIFVIGLQLVIILASVLSHKDAAKENTKNSASLFAWIPIGLYAVVIVAVSFVTAAFYHTFLSSMVGSVPVILALLLCFDSKLSVNALWTWGIRLWVVGVLTFGGLELFLAPSPRWMPFFLGALHDICLIGLTFWRQSLTEQHSQAMRGLA